MSKARTAALPEDFTCADTVNSPMQWNSGAKPEGTRRIWSALPPISFPLAVGGGERRKDEG